MLSEKNGRQALGTSLDPFICGITGKRYSMYEVKDRVEQLARALSKEFGWKPNAGTEWDKVMGVFSLNTVRSTRMSGNLCMIAFLEKFVANA
jgi:hypothetical protein